jgi:hypothetical protein
MHLGMPPIELTFFSVTLFLALAALLEWKRRRLAAQQRVSRGLKGYADRTTAPRSSDVADQEDPSLAIAQ